MYLSDYHLVITTWLQYGYLKFNMFKICPLVFLSNLPHSYNPTPINSIPTYPSYSDQKTWCPPLFPSNQSTSFIRFTFKTPSDSSHCSPPPPLQLLSISPTISQHPDYGNNLLTGLSISILVFLK